MTLIDQIDIIISAEIPDPIEDPITHQIIKKLMIYGPCGFGPKFVESIVNGKCNKYFPKKFNEQTIINE